MGSSGIHRKQHCTGESNCDSSIAHFSPNEQSVPHSQPNDLCSLTHHLHQTSIVMWSITAISCICLKFRYVKWVNNLFPYQNHHFVVEQPLIIFRHTQIVMLVHDGSVSQHISACNPIVSPYILLMLKSPSIYIQYSLIRSPQNNHEIANSHKIPFKSHKLS